MPSIDDLRSALKDLLAKKITREQYNERLGLPSRLPEPPTSSWAVAKMVGDEGERAVKTLLEKLGKKDVRILDMKGGVDLIADGVTFEVKHEPRAEKEFGAVFLETSWRGKVTGPEASRATWFVILLEYRALFVKTDDLRTWLHYADLFPLVGVHKVDQAGDGGAAAGFKVKLDRFTKDAFPSLFVVPRATMEA